MGSMVVYFVNVGSKIKESMEQLLRQTRVPM